MRRTADQIAAHDSLTLAVAPYRVILDQEGWPHVRCRNGWIEYHDGTLLAAYTDMPRLGRRLLAIPGVQRHQAGDDETRILFEPTLLPIVAAVLRAPRRRVLSPEQATRMRLSRTLNAASLAQEAV